MSNRTLSIDDRLHQYMLDVSLRENKVLSALREETSHHKLVNMQISPEQGQFMAMISRMIGAKNYLEVGTFTGYSSTAMALSMPDDARIVCCDISEDFTDVARRYWDRAGISDRITLHLGSAVDTLKGLIEDDQRESFDLMFIDADKENYKHYYELGLELVRPGGLIMIDNVLWGGAVIDADNNDNPTVCIREINKKIATDPRIELSLVPIGDGLTLAQKK